MSNNQKEAEFKMNVEPCDTKITESNEGASSNPNPGVLNDISVEKDIDGGVRASLAS